MKLLFFIFVFQFLICGNCFSQEEKPDLICGMNYESASFPGGKDAMNTWLSTHLCYPDEAIELSLKGRCEVSFKVQADGKISNVKILKGVPDCPECDFEVKYVISSMPNWIPLKENGKAVDSYYQLPITFSIN